MNAIFQLFAQATTEQRWSEVFFGLDQDQRFVLLIIAIGCLAGIIISLVAIVCGLIASLHRRREDGELKRDLLDRGMSAEEVVRIIEAAPPKDWLERWAASRKKK